MHRGERKRGRALLLVLAGAAAAAALPASGPAVSLLPEDAPAAVEAVAPASISYRLKVDVVAYHLPGKTASGIPCAKGVVAVDPKLIPLGTRLFVPGYGRAVAADVGVAIKGRIIDVWMPSHAAARKWGRKTVTITIYR